MADPSVRLEVTDPIGGFVAAHVYITGVRAGVLVMRPEGVLTLASAFAGLPTVSVVIHKYGETPPAALSPAAPEAT